MAETPKKPVIGEGKLALAGLLVLVAGALGSIDQIWSGLENLVERVSKLPPWGRWAAVGVLAAVGLALLIPYGARLFRRSKLARPEAFRLDANNPEHFVGRADDIEVLVRECRDYPLVFLAGESGCGKSTLIRMGLVPALKEDGHLLPLHVDIWSQDWEAGPRNALTDALGKALDDEQREALGLNGPPQPEKLVELLREAKRATGLMPLLVFDQFDDYQARHREKFIPGRRKTWLSAAELVKTNAFWRDVSGLLSDGAVRCLLVTRSDTALGLGSAEFVEPRRISLDRLPDTAVDTLLDRITAPADDGAPVVLDSDRGWTVLRRRLARDLAAGEAVLPQQMKIALAGLATLPALTVGSYVRAGGLAGVEARYVEREIASTARVSQLSREQVRTLLLALIAEHDRSKTAPRTEEELAERIRTPDKPQRVADALAELQRADLVRMRTDPDTRREVWLLDHDYLTRGVLEAERRANIWAAILRDGHEAFREAGRSASRRWRALLGVWPQIRIWALWLGGRLRYGEHRTYVAWSTTRFVPSLVIILAVAAVWFAYERYAEAQRAVGLWTTLSLPDGALPKDDVDALWRLAGESDVYRSSALSQVVTDRGAAARFNRRPELVVRAAVGLDPERRAHALRAYAAKPFDGEVGFERRLAQLNLGVILGSANEGLHRSAVQTIAQESSRWDTRTFAGRWLENLRATAEALGPILSEEIATTAAATSDPFALGALAEGLGALPETTPELAAAAAEVANAIVAAAAATSDPFALRALAEGLTAVAARLTPEAASAAKVELLRAVSVQLGARTASSELDALIATVDMLLPDRQEDAAAEIMRILAFLTIAEKTSALVDMLDKRVGPESFNGDVWAAVKWARGRGIGVPSRPQRPGAPSG